MEIKDRIIEVSFEQFALNGIKSVTMDEIARNMGISKRTLYENFKDKESLVRACIALCSKVAENDRKRALNESKNVLELFFAFIENISVYFKSLNRNFFRDLKRYHSSIYVEFEARQRENSKGMMEMLYLGKDQGYIRQDVNPELAMLLLRSQFDFLWFSDLPVAMNFSFIEMIETMIIVFIRGISTEKGLKLIEEYHTKKMIK